jgi:hypothetical protein
MNSSVKSTASQATHLRQRSKPLLPVRGVMSLVDRNEDEVLRMVEAGELLWAFDVAADPKCARCKELRILPACVADWLRGQTCLLEWADVLAMLLPGNAPLILSKEIARTLNISGALLYTLARRKALSSVTAWHCGPGGCGRFTRASVLKFLRDRRFP